MRFLRGLLEVVAIAGIAVLAVAGLRQVINPYGISGSSMTPSFRDGDYIFVDRVSLAWRPALRGEVIVFHAPSGNGDDLLKRIIGLPGERVVVRDGTVTIFNPEHPAGLVLEESYLDVSTVTNGEADIKLKPNQYFVMGDNRAVSFDSRSWGALDAERIVGKVAMRIWPTATAAAFTAPQY